TAQSSGPVSASGTACESRSATGATCDRATGQPGASGCKTRSGYDDATRRQAGTNRSAGSKLGSARYDAIGDARPEDAEAKERESPKYKRHGIIDRRLVAAEA